MNEEYDKIKVTDLETIKNIKIEDIQYISTSENIRENSTFYFIFLKDHKMVSFKAIIKTEKVYLIELKSMWEESIIRKQIYGRR